MTPTEQEAWAKARAEQCVTGFILTEVAKVGLTKYISQALLSAHAKGRQETETELTNLNVLLPCGHRKVDMDDSYGECVFCNFKRGYEEYEVELTQARADLEQAPRRRKSTPDEK